MDLRMQVTSVGGNTDGPKLVVMRPAPPVDDNDPNMEWTAEGGKPQAELRIYVSHPDLVEGTFVEGSVHEVTVDEGEKPAAGSSTPEGETAPNTESQGETANPAPPQTGGPTSTGGRTSPGPSGPSTGGTNPGGNTPTTP